jgi:hypothetical protein
MQKNSDIIKNSDSLKIKKKNLYFFGFVAGFKDVNSRSLKNTQFMDATVISKTIKNYTKFFVYYTYIV